MVSYKLHILSNTGRVTTIMYGAIDGGYLSPKKTKRKWTKAHLEARKKQLLGEKIGKND